MDNTLLFETERLLLKPTSAEDGPFILQLMNTPKWLKYIGDRNIKSVKDAEDYIAEKMTPQLLKVGFGNFTVIKKEDHIKLGTCGLYKREFLDYFDIGFAFLPEHERKGYAYEAASRIKKAATENFGLTRIAAFTTKDNLASQKLLEKLGLNHVGMMTMPGDDEELMYFLWELNTHP